MTWFLSREGTDGDLLGLAKMGSGATRRYTLNLGWDRKQTTKEDETMLFITDNFDPQWCVPMDGCDSVTLKMKPTFALDVADLMSVNDWRTNFEDKVLKQLTASKLHELLGSEDFLEEEDISIRRLEPGDQIVMMWPTYDKINSVVETSFFLIEVVA